MIISERGDKIGTFRIKANLLINSPCLYYLFQKTLNYFVPKTSFKILWSYKLSPHYWEIWENVNEYINNKTKELLSKLNVLRHNKSHKFDNKSHNLLKIVQA